MEFRIISICFRQNFSQKNKRSYPLLIHISFPCAFVAFGHPPSLRGQRPYPRVSQKISTPSKCASDTGGWGRSRKRLVEYPINPCMVYVSPLAIREMLGIHNFMTWFNLDSLKPGTVDVFTCPPFRGIPGGQISRSLQQSIPCQWKRIQWLSCPWPCWPYKRTPSFSRHLANDLAFGSPTENMTWMKWSQSQTIWENLGGKRKPPIEAESVGEAEAGEI